MSYQHFCFRQFLLNSVLRLDIQKTSLYGQELIKVHQMNDVLSCLGYGRLCVELVLKPRELSAPTGHPDWRLIQ